MSQFSEEQLAEWKQRIEELEAARPAYGRNELIEILQEQVVEITFIKKDGTPRTMRCTLIPSYLVPYERKTDREIVRNEDVLAVWDVENDAWRSINLGTLTMVEFSS